MQSTSAVYITNWGIQMVEFIKITLAFGLMLWFEPINTMIGVILCLH